PALQAGEWWRLLTHQYMHANWIHLGINLTALWAIGSMTVRLLGAWPVLGLYTLSGVAGGLVQGWLSPQAACLGASGAVMGTLGALGVAVWRAGDRLPARWRSRFLKRFGLLVLLQFGADTLIPGVAAADHVAGLVAGALMALCLPVRLRAGPADVAVQRPIGEVSPSGG
ncbi:MAG: rhomboid family intramembrane serine protease, partial [Candidatus Sericytochromatia bacterium]